LKRGAAIVLLGLLVPAGAQPSGPEGYGTDTEGGASAQVVEVSTLATAGPGSLRAALAGSRPARIVFRVAGTIALDRPLTLRRREFVTIDGATAPTPGITLEGHGLRIFESNDIVIRHVRVRGPKGDGIAIRGSRRIAVHHCSLTDARDENISLTQGTREATVSWCIIGHTRRDGAALSGMLIADFDRTGMDRISVHHNLFVNNAQRSPQVSARGVVDFRNNVVWDWEAYGMRLRRGARGNIVNNVFRTRDRGDAAVRLTADAGPAYVSGNLSPRGVNVDDLSTATSPYPAAFVTTQAASEAESLVVHGAGAHPRDDVDARLVRRRSDASRKQASEEEP
jgi:pectate lyase